MIASRDPVTELFYSLIGVFKPAKKAAKMDTLTLSHDELVQLRQRFFTPEPQENTAANVVSFHPVVRALEKAGGSVGSNRELARLMKCSEGEASKRVSEVYHLVAAQKVGKEVRISLRRSA